MKMKPLIPSYQNRAAFYDGFKSTGRQMEGPLFPVLSDSIAPEYFEDTLQIKLSDFSQSYPKHERVPTRSGSTSQRLQKTGLELAAPPVQCLAAIGGVAAGSVVGLSYAAAKGVIRTFAHFDAVYHNPDAHQKVDYSKAIGHGVWRVVKFPTLSAPIRIIENAMLGGIGGWQVGVHAKRQLKAKVDMQSATQTSTENEDPFSDHAEPVHQQNELTENSHDPPGDNPLSDCDTLTDSSDTLTVASINESQNQNPFDD